MIPRKPSGVAWSAATLRQPVQGLMSLVLILAGVALALVAPAAGGTVPAPTGSEFHVNTYTTGSQGYSAVAGSADGSFVVVWESAGSSGSDDSYNSILAQRYDGTGTPAGGEFEVNAYTTNGQGRPAVAMTADGDFVAVWSSDGQDGSLDGIFGQRFDAMGTTVGPEFQVNTHTTGTQRAPAVAVDADGDFVVVWQSVGGPGTDPDNTVLGQRFDSTATPQGAEFQVNTYTTSFQGGAAVAMDADGNFVVVWNSDGSAGSDSSEFSVLAQRYDSAGVPQGGEFQVNTYTTARQVRPDVAMDADGNFVVVWDSEGSPGSDDDGYSILAQRYDDTGAAIGGEFQVNTYTTNDQEYPAVAGNADGAFVVVWHSDGSPGSDDSLASVLGRYFDSTGTAQGAEFQANTFTTGNQWRAAVTMDPEAGFVVVWQSRYQGDYATGVFGQRFEQVVTTTSTTTTTLPGTIGVSAKKLIVIDKLTAASKAKVVFVAKDMAVTKGSGLSTSDISASFDFDYANGATAGSFTIPSGASDGTDGWTVNKATVAKYVNKSAPGGPTGAKVAVIKPTKLLKIVGKDLGDLPIDIFTTGAPDPSGVDTVYTVTNGGHTNRHCTNFSGADCTYKLIAGGTGAKLVCKPGSPSVCP
jgi:hypothetical protein